MSIASSFQLDAGDTKNRVVIHTFASQLAIKGVPLIKIKNLVNHVKLSHDSGRSVIEGLYNVY